MALNPKQFHAHLYHGTSSKSANKIVKEGINTTVSYLTHDRGLAAYYADTASEEDESDPRIITVRVNPRNLSPDYKSFDEPVHARDYDAEPREFDYSELRHSKDWANSLRQTGAVKHEGPIPKNNIVDVEEGPRIDTWNKPYTKYPKSN